MSKVRVIVLQVTTMRPVMLILSALTRGCMHETIVDVINSIANEPLVEALPY